MTLEEHVIVETQHPDALKKDHILIVEDDPSIRRILRLQLEIEGYVVTEAEDGRLALGVLETLTPDLIILDVMMPTMDGNEACRQIRLDTRFRHTPIIFLTAKSSSDSRIEGLVEGANDYLTKPYERSELLLRIKNLIGWGRAQRNCNPLTGLPGNPAIESEVGSRLASGKDFSFLYLDLDNFKAYNDFYGYRAGDQVIQLLARALSWAVKAKGAAGDFVGHVGGDDFVALAASDRGARIAQAVIALFDREVLSLYQPREREQGYVDVENRRGEIERFPLVSVTIALVETEHYQIEHAAMLNDVVAELKKLGKQQPGSVVIRDRRQDPPLAKTG